MAKKKVSHAQHEKASQKQEESVKPNQEIAPPSMDSEKLETLKALNQRLLKEAVERRQHVDSLLKSKGSLEVELTRSNSEREGLESELALLVEQAAELEVERRVVSVFVAAQVGEKGEEFDRKMKGLEREMSEWKREVEGKKSEIVRLNGTLSEIEGTMKDERMASKRVRVERDVFEAKLNRRIEEDEGLRAELTELSGKMRGVEREFEELRTSYNAVVKEKGDMEVKIKLVKGERDLSERSLMESKKLIAKMKEEISVIVGEKEGVEKEKNAEMVKRRELENDVTGLNEKVANLQKEEVKLQTVVAALEKKCVEGEEKLKEMGREIDRLVDESEKKILGLVDEKRVIENEKNAEMVKRQELENDVTGLNEMVANLQKEEVKLQTDVAALEKKCVEGEEKLKQKGREIDRIIGENEKKILGLVDEKRVIEKEKNAEMVKRQELENDVTGLNEMVTNLQKEEVKLQTVVAALEKKCVEGEEKLKQMEREVDGIIDENEKKILGLVDEKRVIEKDLGEALKQLAEQKREIGDLANEKIVILEAKNRVDCEVGEMRNHVDELKAAVLELEELNRADVEKIRSLESEVGDYRCKLEKINVERDSVKRCLNEEKQNGVRLKESIQELKKIIEESHKVAGEVKAKNAAILTEKVELESRCEMLKKEIVSLQDSMVKARDEFDTLKSKFKSADANSKQVLNLLKGTSAFCSKDECDGEVGNLLVDGDDLKLHVVEMETIKKAFKSKVAKVEDMKRQLEYLESSVVDEQKKKSFWTMLSSATTLLAALSLAYVARGH